MSAAKKKRREPAPVAPPPAKECLMCAAYKRRMEQKEAELNETIAALNEQRASLKAPDTKLLELIISRSFKDLQNLIRLKELFEELPP
jgi:hypothetical protein